MHEIVTLQFGQRANYLATHFWNLQESYFTYTHNESPSVVDHDINFRPGIGTDGSDTYTPRTIIYDLKGGFGTLKQQNALYNDTTSSASHNYNTPQIWNENGLTTIKQPPIQSIPYQQDLDAGLPPTQLHKSQIRYWSDFNRVFFHPRSIVQLNEYTLNSSIAPFENWHAGIELYRDVDRDADLLDRDVRPFVEECDSIQGFQVFAGADDAWGGWTSRYVDALMDEYTKKSVWVYGLEDTRQSQREKMIARKANAARTLSEVSKLASVYIMLGTRPSKLPNYINCDFTSEWEMSAIVAAAVETATLPTRLRDGAGITQRSTMQQLEQFLSSEEGRNIWELGLGVDRSRESELSQAQVNSDGNDNGNDIGTTDARAPQRDPHTQTQTQHDMAEDIESNEPTVPDIIFTPTSSHLLRPTTTSRQRQPQALTPPHTFTQLTTSRYPKVNPLKRSSNLPLPLHAQQYHLPSTLHISLPLSYPLTTATPPSLFPSTSLSASYTTATTQKQNLFTLRDLVTRQNRAIDLDEREELYDALTGLGERYTYGEEGDEDDDWGSEEG